MNEKEMDAYLDDFLTPYWQNFVDENNDGEQSFQSDEELEAMYALIKGFMSGMVVNGAQSIPQITEDDIQAAIGMLDKAPTDAEPEFDDLVDHTLTLGHLFLAWLSVSGSINLTGEQIDGVFGEDLSYLSPMDDMADIDRDEYHYDRADLDEYRSETANEVSRQAEKAAELFIDSKALNKLDGQVDEDDEDNIILTIQSLAVHLYGEYRQLPFEEWTGSALKAVLTGYIVKDAFLASKDYQSFGPILKAFIDFIAGTQLMTATVGKSLKKAIDEATPEMIRLGQDETNYSETKQLILSVKENKTDPSETLFKLLDDSSDDNPFDMLDQPDNKKGKPNVVSMEDWKDKPRKKGKKNKKPKKR
ncbi:hypothetical protein [Lentilactobacillus hilgardii]|jgi:hypothetical protein|uniref:Uncharacterized protein n=1 Tax=Lentilactobacillus hilgardii TaxID=1588 RepID=A0A6P1E5K2_LENHI|nr:hypothetical protein [Lentilactobacillus hilgardii]EEI71737.1 hypothetical protein HMPREF0496_1014 [Lentilactobacillus hilgardii ATCC 27305]MCT3393124.1 hypothetical protein [Lentilactobacillus hilgardii]QHB51390.1 hypothetical protein GQR93_03755 [Lentilactobacillus hilgardii]RRG10305.1 MAG: hypothetical protein DUD35_07815 [Lactobacillus sp.]